jgi:hypothetical protein
MNGPERAVSLPSQPDLLARLAQEQLAREEALLQTNLEGLRQVWAALRGNDQQALQAALEQQALQEPQREAIRQERNQFRQRAAAILGLAPKDVHLGLVVKHVRGESAHDLEHHLKCLRQRTQEAEQLRDHVFSLTCHCLSFLNRFLLDLMGTVDGGRYGPAGVCPEPASGVLFEMRG